MCILPCLNCVLYWIHIYPKPIQVWTSRTLSNVQLHPTALPFVRHYHIFVVKHICHSLYCDLQLSTQIVKPSISSIFTKIRNLKLKISIFPPFVNIFFNVKATEIVYCTLATSFINFYTQFHLINFFLWQIKIFYTHAKKNLINPPTFSHFPYNTNFKLFKNKFSSYMSH